MSRWGALSYADPLTGPKGLDDRLTAFYRRQPAAVASKQALAKAGFSSTELARAVARGILRCGVTGCWLPHEPDPGAMLVMNRQRKARPEPDEIDGAFGLSPRARWGLVLAMAGGGALAAAMIYMGTRKPDPYKIVPGVPLLPDGAKEMGLEPDTRRLYQILRSRMAAMGVPLFTGSTIRDLAEQEKLVAEGKSAAPISWHNVGRAVDAYPIDPSTGQPDLNGKRQDLFRLMHQEWAKLGGDGLAFLPYPDGPVRRINTSKGPVWDGGHLEYHGNFVSATQALQAQQGYA